MAFLMMTTTERLAIVVFSLGGPDSPEAVRPFLFNLFFDPYIIALPMPIRWLIATLISSTRAEKSRGYYAKLGGKSVLPAETRAQAAALETAAKGLAGDVRTFVFMRYWHPMAAEVVAQLKDYAPTRVVVLPLYPQFSTTTTTTSMEALKREAKKQGFAVPLENVCCYPTSNGFLTPMVEAIKRSYGAAALHGKPRVLMSAHGLPQKTIDRGDPYQWQVEQTATALVTRLGIADLDAAICYQSRVGPVAWIGPSIEAEIARAGADKVPLVVAPISFVSEHVETLVELDETMREYAKAAGVPHYERVPAVRTEPRFIGLLADLVTFLKRRPSPCSGEGRRICPKHFTKCPIH